MEKITTIEIEEAVARYFDYRKNLIVPNVSWGFHIHECDLLIARKSGHLIEVEIKISKADLKKDGQKWHNHIDYYDRIKELWFAIPEYLRESIEYIPERAGILIMQRSTYNNKLYCKTLRDPVINSKARKIEENEILKLARLGTMRIWKLKCMIMNHKKRTYHKHIIEDPAQKQLFK